MIGLFLTVSTCYKRSLVYSTPNHRENLSHLLLGGGGGVSDACFVHSGIIAFQSSTVSTRNFRRPYNFHFLMIFFWVKKSSSLNLSRYKFISTENSRSQIQGSFPLANLYLPGEPCAQFALTEFTVIRWLINVSPLSETAYLLTNIRKSCKLEQRHSGVLLRPVFQPR